MGVFSCLTSFFALMFGFDNGYCTSIEHKYAVLLPCSITYHFSTALNDGIFNCVRRVGVMPTSMRRNYATPALVRRHFDITCWGDDLLNTCCVGPSLMQYPPLSTIEVCQQ